DRDRHQSDRRLPPGNAPRRLDGERHHHLRRRPADGDHRHRHVLARDGPAEPAGLHQPHCDAPRLDQGCVALRRQRAPPRSGASRPDVRRPEQGGPALRRWMAPRLRSPAAVGRCAGLAALPPHRSSPVRHAQHLHRRGRGRGGPGRGGPAPLRQRAIWQRGL
ncbi:MAG: 4-hydroxyphenylacetate 3-monooxygenase, reductase component, partial [uncultured Sphingosinicella sp.]